MTLVESSWDRLRDGFIAKGFSDREINNFRLIYVAGLYTASAAINAEDATAGAISEAAYRIELKAVS